MSFQPAVSNSVDDLTRCPDCRWRLVYPADWYSASPTHWHVRLRCPNCEWTCWGLFDQRTVDAFDFALDLGTHELVCDLRRLEHEHMAREADRFAIALAADAILPEDF